MAIPLRVLILEDVQDDADLILHELRRAGFDPDWGRVDNEADYRARLSPTLDVILADYSLPTFDAPRALTLLQGRELDVPFIIVSGSVGEETAVAAMRQGAADYLLKDRLARLGPAVTQALEQKRLRAETRRALESLREANRRKDQFLAMLAHELRNPLAPIRNGLYILGLSGEDAEAAAKVRQMMERQVGHLTRLIDDLLDVTRISRRKIELRPERLDLVRLARQSAEDHDNDFRRVGLSVRFDLPATPVWVKADPTRLAQVLDNLLENALKFTDRGGEVAVRLVALPDTRQAVLTIRDTGVGIEPEVLPQLFEPFTQADQSLERSRGGLGLGLSLVRGLVELHGGKVQAASSGKGRGAEFTVWLPLAEEPPALLPKPARQVSGTKPLRVLVVEDNPDAAESLRILLELGGHEVRVAHSGPAGVGTAKEVRPQVVLCDIGLPGMDGYAVAAALRQDPATAGARLIAVTGYGQAEDVRRALEAGFHGHLVKPVLPERLFAQLEACPG
jgi:signal transduction histidine kinase